MKKIKDPSKKILFLSNSEDSNSPFINLKPIEHEKEYKFSNNINSMDNLLKKSPKNVPCFKKAKFLIKQKKFFFKVLNGKQKRKINKNNNSFSNGRWTKEERNKFAYSLWKFGTDWKKIRQYITSRSIFQIISHSQKYLMKLKSNEYIIQKGLNIQKLNWEECFKCLKQNLNDAELFFVITSVECDIGDNNRMSNKYLKKKCLVIKENFHWLKEYLGLAIFNEFRNNNNFNKSIFNHNELNIFNNKENENNLISLNECSNDNDSGDLFNEIINLKNDNYYFGIKNNEYESFDNISLLSINNNNIFDINKEMNII